VGHIATYRILGRGQDTYGVLVGEIQGKRALGKSKHRWEENIKIDLQ